MRVNDITEFTLKLHLFLQSIYYFGIMAALKEMFLDPDFCTARSRAIIEGKGALRGTPEFQRLKAKCGGFLDNPDNGLIDIGADAYQPFTFVTHSTHLVVIRWNYAASV